MSTLRAHLLRLRHPARYALLRDLLRQQALSPAALAEYQRAALADLLRHAATWAPYYRERLAGIDPDQAALSDLPVLTKADVRAHRDALLTTTSEREAARVGHTGGSTGAPLTFWYDEAKHERMRAGMLRGFMLTGWRPGQRVMHLWGAARDTARGGVFGGGRLGERWRGLIDGERALAATAYDEAALAGWARQIRRFRPALLYGYTSVLDALARFHLDARLPPPSGLIAAVCTAEMLDDAQRARIETAFACKLHNQYGSREVPNIAWECRHGGLHVMSDSVLLESAGAADAQGNAPLRVTSLTDRLMPFIRYELGDSGRLLHGDCACGLAFPRMATGVCRQNDSLRAPDGTTLHPSFFNRLLYGERGIRQYQWARLGPAHLRLSLVGERLPAEREAALRAALRPHFGPDARLEFDYVARIAPSAAGKHRFIIDLHTGD